MQNFDRTYDHSMRLKDAALHASGTTVGQVDGSNASVYIGAAHFRGDCVIDVTACEVGNGDELYKIQVIGATDSGWAASHVLGEITLGDSSVIPNAVDKTTGRFILPFHNAIPLAAGDTFPTYCSYLRIRTIGSGTIASGINYKAYVAKRQ